MRRSNDGITVVAIILFFRNLFLKEHMSKAQKQINDLKQENLVLKGENFRLQKINEYYEQRLGQLKDSI